MFYLYKIYRNSNLVCLGWLNKSFSFFLSDIVYYQYCRNVDIEIFKIAIVNSMSQKRYYRYTLLEIQSGELMINCRMYLLVRNSLNTVVIHHLLDGNTELVTASTVHGLRNI